LFVRHGEKDPAIPTLTSLFARLLMENCVLAVRLNRWLSV